MWDWTIARTSRDPILDPNTFYNNSTSLNSASESVLNSEAYTYTIENLLTYDKTFKEKNRLRVTGLYSVQKDHNQASGIFGTGYSRRLYSKLQPQPGGFGKCCNSVQCSGRRFQPVDLC